MYRIVFLINSLIILVGFSGCTEKGTSLKLPFYNSPDFSPIFISGSDQSLQRISHTIDNFSFTDQNGNQVTQKDIEGKIHVASFIFTSCGSICPVMVKNLKLVQEQFRQDTNVVLLSYSVTPWIDSVTRLRKYAVANGIESINWHLLTGNRGEIYKLARQSYFAEEDIGFTKDSTEFLHTEHILLVDKTKRIRGIYNGTLQLEAEQLINDIKELQKE